jgi:hypothetical protein
VSDLTVTGEDRDDVAASLHVMGRGFDQMEAEAAAKAPKVTLEASEDALSVSLESAAQPNSRTGPLPMLSLTLRVPKRLSVRAEPHIGRFVLTSVAGADIMSSRGDTTISALTKDLRLTHTGGALDIANVAALKLTARNSHGTVKDVAGPLTIDAVSGDLTLGGVTGPIEIEGRNTAFTLETGERLEPELRINMTGGRLQLKGLRVAARIDGRNSDINVVLATPAPVTIYNVGAIVVTAPPGGYDLDAAATDGRITSEDSSITATPSDGPDARASAKIRGGGPPLTLRATRGTIEVRKPAVK